MTALEQEVYKQQAAFGVHEDYTSALELAEVGPINSEAYVSLGEAVELIPEHTLENELRLARGEATTVSIIAAAIDGRKEDMKEIHGNISELVQRALRAGGLMALLSKRLRQGQGA